MKEFTQFQINCEAKLIEALKQVGLHVTGRRLDGIRETYVRAKISDTDYTVFIYDDEASIEGPKTDLRFESPDYDSDEELTRDFVAKVMNLFK